jgi:hypothetical protein
VDQDTGVPSNDIIYNQRIIYPPVEDQESTNATATKFDGLTAAEIAVLPFQDETASTNLAVEFKTTIGGAFENLESLGVPEIPPQGSDSGDGGGLSTTKKIGIWMIVVSVVISICIVGGLFFYQSDDAAPYSVLFPPWRNKRKAPAMSGAVVWDG